MNKQPIGFIDSGVGGLTVVKEALHQLPAENTVYLGDQARLPYGPRPAEQVQAFTWQMVNFLLTKHIKMLVIACNTATAAALPLIKAKLSIPVIGVIKPGSRAALKATRTGHIGIIATEGTVKSGAYTQALRTKAPDIRLTSLAAPKFVSLVESNEAHSPIAKRVVADTLQPLLHTDIDTLVLGCTHYPILRPIIQNVMGSGVTLIDSGAETVNDVSMLLDYFDLANDSHETPTHAYYTTGAPSMFDELGEAWLELKAPMHAQHVNIESEPTHFVDMADITNGKTIVVASKNPGKVKEFKAMFEPAGVTVKSLADFPSVPTVDETGTTFEENARQKADQYAKDLQLPVIADDSGLMVDALDGQPGIRSARYAGDGHNDAANNAKLLANLADVPDDARTATFHTTLVLAKPDHPEADLVVHGDLSGQITAIPRGTDGFGYDPFFLVPSLGKTLAELTAEEKNQISHRGNAMRSLEKVWQAWLEEEI
ncbi:glutamate racemase [Lacticaseibacillus casei]|uniref:Multifunctional fusion protein n=1 Tax=Lacticaseibacillus huelsenbergensis TaxID=3035291 RepID=A0ABY8DY10_9LACO|nr:MULTISPECIES: glutamate racemase [Lacticaseibacillus]MDG3062951.1 glutamate racemase [Lacticaseibacillus sp. BCRC 81376]QVI38770.1 glutamate racemase [Lacticaseibacillus casei]QXG60590.1 glutamate racemase [Lacticaseibacillus casei]WFB40662.1 glutamate racemase [Lacticaseibacillus huelsenbergensis]WFB43408.1 glutamate racemase [Lacticaseibacillus huelsenbergensis]